MGTIVKAWPLISKNTFDFQAPRGTDLPFGEFFDFGLIKKDVRPRILDKDTSHASPVKNNVYNYSGQSDFYVDYENGEWDYEITRSGFYKTKKKPIKFYDSQVVTIYGTKTLFNPTRKFDIFYVGIIQSVTQPEVNEDGTFDDSTISIKCLYVVKDNTGGIAIENWVIDYAGKSNNPGTFFGGDYFNLEQNENRRSKFAISGGSAKFDFPFVDPYREPDITTESSESGFFYQEIKYYGGRFFIVPDDEKHLPWSGITVSVSHANGTLITTYNPNPTITSVTENYENGTYTTFVFAEYAPETVESISQQPVNYSYEFKAEDYELYKESISGQEGTENENFVDLGGSTIFTVEDTYIFGIIGIYGTILVPNEEGELVPEFYESLSEELIGVNSTTQDGNYWVDFLYDTQTDYNESNNSYVTFVYPDYQFPYWPINPIGGNPGQGSYSTYLATSDQFEKPSPEGFFYYDPTS